MRTGRPKTGVARVKVSCRLHPAALERYRAAGGKNLSTDLARLFERRWQAPEQSVAELPGTIRECDALHGSVNTCDDWLT